MIHPEPIKVAYKDVRELVPKLWAKDGELKGYGEEKEGDEERGQENRGMNKIDYMIHIGMATGRKWYSIERKGHRDGYVLKDVDGEICEDQLLEGHSIQEAPKEGEQKSAEEDNGDAQAVLKEEKEENDETKADSSKEKWIWEGLPSEIETSIDVDDVWKRWRISLPVRFSPLSFLFPISSLSLPKFSFFCLHKIEPGPPHFKRRRPLSLRFHFLLKPRRAH